MSIYAPNTGIMKPPSAQAQGRRMGQVANPFQQNEGEDKNVEQQALGQALGQPQAEKGPQPAQSMANVPGPVQSSQGQIPVSIGMMGGAAAYPQSFASQAGLYGPNGNTGINGGKVQAQPGGFVPQPSQQPAPQPSLAYSQAPVAGRPFLLGFETSKIYDPNKQAGESGKYTPAAKAFGQAYMGGVDIARGNLEPMLNTLKSQFPNARIVGDDKIDFGDGNGPIDVVRSDGSIVFQNTTGNPVYEQAYAAGQVGHGAPQAALSQALAMAPTAQKPAGGGGKVDSIHDYYNPGPMAPGGNHQPHEMTPAEAAAAGLGWVPKGHPLYGTPGFVGSQQGASGTSLPPGQGGGGAPSDPAVYHPGQLPTTDLPDYEAYKFDQFSNPDLSGIDNPTQALLKQVLGSTSMSDQNVAQLKEKNKEEALAMQKQLADQIGSSFAGRGLSGGGQEMASRRRLGEDVLSHVLSGNRDVDLRKMTQDRADQAQALGLAGDYMNSAMGRATQGYGARLAGENAQAGENFRGYGSRADATRFALERALQQEQLNKAGADSAFGVEMGRGDLASRNRGLDIQRELGMGGLDIDRARLTSSDRQFDLSNALARQELAERMRQFNNQLGYNYNALSQSGQNDMMRLLLGL